MAANKTRQLLQAIKEARPGDAHTLFMSLMQEKAEERISQYQLSLGEGAYTDQYPPNWKHGFQYP